jgi:hypothetical protein
VHPIERLRAVARARDVDQRLLAREAAMVLGVLADDPFGLLTSCRRLLDRHPGAGTLWWACARLLDAGDPRAEARAVARDLGEDDAVLRTLGLDLPEHATVVVVPDAAGGSELVDRLAVRRDDLVPVQADDPALDVAAVVEAGASLDHDHAPAPDPFGGDPSRSTAADQRGSRGRRDPLDVPPVGTPGLGPTVVLVEAGGAGPDRFLGVPGTADGIAAAKARGLPVWLVVGTGARLPAALFDAAAARALGCETVPTSATARLVEPRTIPCPCPPELLRPWPAS